MDYFPPNLLEACVMVGASREKLQDVYQEVISSGGLESVVLEPEILYIAAPPFLSRAVQSDTLHSRWPRWITRSKKEQPPKGVFEEKGAGEDISVPKNLDLTALPQLCFPDGLNLSNEEKNVNFHFLVFTDIFGNKTHGVVMQCYRPILEGGMASFQNGGGSSEIYKLFIAYSFCVISKYPYFNALKDCLSCLLKRLQTCQFSEMEEQVKDFATKLSLVPIPPPGHLHLMFTMPPLTITLPPGEDKEHLATDLDLHLPFLCFRPQQILLILSSLMQEQQVVLFSADWARITLIAESLLIYLQPFTWQHPYVPILAKGMLDFLMAPTGFLMGCHLSHLHEIATETDNLILVNIDDGSVSTSSSDSVDLPYIPHTAADCFIQRCQSLQMHYDLDQCHEATCTGLNEQRAQRRSWQQELNHYIKMITLELMVNVFRDLCSHLNYEHLVFHSEEFLKTKELDEQLFYKKVLETHMFHSFLRDRLNKKLDNFARMELSTRCEIQKMKAVSEMSRRPTMPDLCDNRKSFIVDKRIKRLGRSLPDLGEHLGKMQSPRIRMSDPDFPASLSFNSVQNYHGELIQRLGKALLSIKTENSALLARFYYLRGFINISCSRFLDALSDFQNLYKTDSAIFPSHVVTWIVDSLHEDERQQAQKRPELKTLIFKIKSGSRKPPVQTANHIKRFRLPKNPLDQGEFVRCVQECGIVKEAATIHRLFNALTDGQSKQVEPELFGDFYSFWRETEAEAQQVNVSSEVIDYLGTSECVYKLSSCIKTSRGVGKIAMTEKRLFLLTEGRPGFLEITKFRDIQEVKVASSSFLLRVSSLRIQTRNHPEVFEANMKTETELWNLLVKEMWAGCKMADQHKDPQYRTQALTNVMLMNAVVGCLQAQRSLSAASKLAYFDRIQHEAPMVVPKTTSETLKHRINPSLDLAEPQTVHVLLYTPGQLGGSNSVGELTPKLWVALSGGKVVVFDAACWSMLQECIQVGEARVTCMMGLVQDQVWMGSQDSVIYIIDTCSMSCNKQLTEHRHEVVSLCLDTNNGHHTYSCSCDGTILQWDSVSLKVKRQFHVSCARLCSVQIVDGILWCCCGDSIVGLKKSGSQQRRILLPEYLRIMPSSFSCLVVIPEQGQIWTGCSDASELCIWQINNIKHPFKRLPLLGGSGITCMIRVKNQIWVGCRGWSVVGGYCDSQLRSQLLVVDLESFTVTKELQAHSDTIQTLCSAEDRYVLSGSACRDGKIAIWKSG